MCVHAQVEAFADKLAVNFRLKDFLLVILNIFALMFVVYW